VHRFGILVAGVALVVRLASADARDCACDASRPETMSARECGLCREAEKQPPEQAVFFLKDINPRKPNRLLALPRAHTAGPHELFQMSADERLALWTAAIEKAKSTWGTQWGLAVNGDESRTQCHMHIHIGRLLDGVETPNFVAVDGPAQIPAPKDGGGMWVHPAGDKLHVHLGEIINETVLLR
jgi:diadenosine tetraphosphate (Ap4A) HIT family hydrolase